MTTFAVATPCYRTFEFKFVTSLARLLHAQTGVQFISCMNAGVEVGRSRLATQFLTSLREDVLLFIDTDIRYEATDAIRIANQAKEHNAVIGGVYPGRSSTHPFPVGLPDQQPITFFDISQPELVPVEFVGGAFMAIPRPILTALADGMETIDGYYPLFHTFDRDGFHYAEDVAFCDRVTNAGFPILANTWIQLGHIGQYEYTLRDMARDQASAGPLTIRRDGATYKPY